METSVTTVELLIYIVGAIVSGWITARWMWTDNDKYFVVPTVMLIWPLVLVCGILCGITWLFIKSAEPGVIRLPKWRPNWNRIFRNRAVDLEEYIAELEAELEIAGREKDVPSVHRIEHPC